VADENICDSCCVTARLFEEKKQNAYTELSSFYKKWFRLYFFGWGTVLKRNDGCALFFNFAILLGMTIYVIGSRIARCRGG
jgi:hypothetical protein